MLGARDSVAAMSFVVRRRITRCATSASVAVKTWNTCAILDDSDEVRVLRLALDQAHVLHGRAVALHEPRELRHMRHHQRTDLLPQLLVARLVKALFK